MDYLIINGSHHLKGNSQKVSDILKNHIKENNKSCEEIKLAEKNYKYCLGCLECEETEECTIKDSFEEVIKKIKETKNIIFITPCYFDMPTARMKNFIDRCNPICSFLEENKKGYFNIIIGQADEASCLNADKCLNDFASIMNMNKIYEQIIFILPVSKDEIEYKLRNIVIK